MSTNRKEFLKITGLAAGGFLFKPGWSDSTARGIRKDFELEKDLVFLNNATMGPSPKQVSQAVTDQMKRVNGKTIYRGVEKKLLKHISHFFGIDKGEIALTHNVTEGINTAAWGVPLKKGDEILMTGHEHVGGALPWLNRQKLEGIRVKTFPLMSTAQDTLDALFKAVTSRTRIIAVPHIPCTIGQVLPISEIGKEARKRGIFTVIDGAHPVGMMPLNIKELNCDIYVSCFHKWLCGPKGTGFMYISRNMQKQLSPHFIGSHGATWDLGDNSMHLNAYSETAHKYYYGTQNNALYAGMIAAMVFQEQHGREAIFQHGKALASRFRNFLEENRSQYTILTPSEEASSASIVSFKRKEKGRELYDYLRKHKIITRFVPESNLNCSRISFHLYNTKEEVDQLIKQMKAFV